LKACLGRPLRPSRLTEILQASRRWWIGEKLSTAVVPTLGFTWWLGWSLLVTLTTTSNRVAAVLISIVAAVLIVIGLDKGWLQTDGEDGE
jgi:hypothetical protein